MRLVLNSRKWDVQQGFGTSGSSIKAGKSLVVWMFFFRLFFFSSNMSRSFFFNLSLALAFAFKFDPEFDLIVRNKMNTDTLVFDCSLCGHFANDRLICQVYLFFSSVQICNLCSFLH